jgi:iron uptake system component EfeO
MRTRGLLAAAASAVLAAAVTACGSSAPPRSPSSTAISFNDASCGSTWHLARAGWHTFEITSQAENGAEVDLTNPATGAVYDELEDIGPGTTAPMSLDVGSGKYAFICLVQDFGPVNGPTVTVSGHTPGTAAILPVTYNDLYH